MLGEYVEQEEFCKLQASDSVMSRDEDGLFREPIYYDQNSCEPVESGSCSIKSMDMEFQGLSRTGSCFSNP